MKKALKITLGVLASLVVAGAIFVTTYAPAQRPAPEVTIEATTEVVARGKYLVEHVTACTTCHGQRDFTRYAAPVKGTPGEGGECHGAEAGFPGTVCIPNITPHDEAGIGRWSDGEILRAIREGVDRDGEVLFPMMPYESYRSVSDGDAQAIVAYLRTLPTSEATPPQQTAIDFPVSFFIKLAPAPVVEPVTAPPRDDEIAYGRYLATMAGCRFCHTPLDDQHQPIWDREMAGGHVHHTGHGQVVAPNLTPHTTGLKQDRRAFIAMFKSFASPEAAAPVDPADNTLMPWLAYAGMTEDDLGAIHAYLSSLPPIDNAVERHPGTSAVAKDAGVTEAAAR